MGFGNMRDYHRTFRPLGGQGAHGETPKVIKTFRLNLPDDWKELRRVDPEGWLDIPDVDQVEPKGGRLIVVKIRSERGIRFRLMDKERFDRLVEQVDSKEFLFEEMGLEDKSEFFCAVDSVDYHPTGKVKLTTSQLITLQAETEVELRLVKGDLEIGRPS
jgi:hypothetical protein